MRRQRVSFFIGLLLVGLAPAAFAPPAPEPARAGERRVTQMVPMRDGKRLATDILLPSGEGPWPAAFYRTPYGRARVGGDRFTAAGIVVVVQDMRGTGNSEGEFRLGLDDAWGRLQDPADTIAWIRRAPWSNGKIATYGMPIPQSLLAGSAPAGLVGQHANTAPLSLYHHAFYRGGVPRLPWFDFVRAQGWPEAIVQSWREHPHYDDFWRAQDLGTRVEKMRWPTVHSIGWFHSFLQGAIDAFAEPHARGGDGARGRQHLVIGPWADESRPPKAGDLTFPANAAAAPGAPDELEWLLYWFSGHPEFPSREPAVRYYVMGDTTDPRARQRLAHGRPLAASLAAAAPLPRARRRLVANTAAIAIDARIRLQPGESCPIRGRPGVERVAARVIASGRAARSAADRRPTRRPRLHDAASRGSPGDHGPLAHAPRRCHIGARHGLCRHPL